MVDFDITILEETIREAAESARRFRPLLRSLTWTTITCAVLMLVVSTALCMIANEEYVTSCITLSTTTSPASARYG